MSLPFSRIRTSRSPDPRAFTAQAHRASHLIAHTEPAYPSAARDRRIEGRVLLHAIVARDGSVQSVSAEAGHPLLAESAAATIRSWKYRPTTVNGVPVEVQTEIEVTFTLPDIVVSS